MSHANTLASRSATVSEICGGLRRLEQRAVDGGARGADAGLHRIFGHLGRETRVRRAPRAVFSVSLTLRDSSFTVPSRWVKLDRVARLEEIQALADAGQTRESPRGPPDRAPYAGKWRPECRCGPRSPRWSTPRVACCGAIGGGCGPERGRRRRCGARCPDTPAVPGCRRPGAGYRGRHAKESGRRWPRRRMARLASLTC